MKDSFLQTNSDIFYTTSMYEMKNFLLGREKQYRVIYIPSTYTSDGKSYWVSADAYFYTHNDLVYALIEEGFIIYTNENKELLNALGRRTKYAQQENSFIYIPLNLDEIKKEGKVNKLISTDYVFRFYLFKNCIIAEKTLSTQKGQDFLKLFGEYKEFYNYDNLVDYLKGNHIGDSLNNRYIVRVIDDEKLSQEEMIQKLYNIANKKVDYQFSTNGVLVSNYIYNEPKYNLKMNVEITNNGDITFYVDRGFNRIEPFKTLNEANAYIDNIVKRKEAKIKNNEEYNTKLQKVFSQYNNIKLVFDKINKGASIYYQDIYLGSVNFSSIDNMQFYVEKVEKAIPILNEIYNENNLKDYVSKKDFIETCLPKNIRHDIKEEMNILKSDNVSLKIVIDNLEQKYYFLVNDKYHFGNLNDAKEKFDRLVIEQKNNQNNAIKKLNEIIKQGKEQGIVIYLNNDDNQIETLPFKIDNSSEYNPYFQLVYSSYNNSILTYLVSKNGNIIDTISANNFDDLKNFVLDKRNRKSYLNKLNNGEIDIFNVDEDYLSDEPITSGSGYVGGYSGYSMSNSARQSEDNGSLPLSKWNKNTIIETIQDNTNELNFLIPYLKQLSLEQLKDICLYEDGYHHTSKFYNKTIFYSIDSPRNIYNNYISLMK